MFLVAWRMCGVLMAGVWAGAVASGGFCVDGQGRVSAGQVTRLWECGQAVEAAARSVAHGQVRSLGSTDEARQAPAPAVDQVACAAQPA